MEAADTIDIITRVWGADEDMVSSYVSSESSESSSSADPAETD